MAAQEEVRGLGPSEDPHRREATHCNATSASLKHFTWAPRPSAFCCWALLSANTTPHVLVGGPDAGVRPAGPPAAPPPPSTAGVSGEGAGKGGGGGGGDEMP